MRSVRWGVRADLFFYRYILWPSLSKYFPTSQIAYLCAHAMVWLADYNLLVVLSGK